MTNARTDSIRVLARVLAAGVASVGPAWAADDCDGVRADVERKIRASGAAGYTLEVLDAGASAPGKVVGSCARGSRLIVYRRAPAADSAPVITECKDGSTPVGGVCPKK